MAQSYDSPMPSHHHERPIDWPSDEWEAFGFLHEGATVQEVANYFGKTTGAVTRWITKWRARYGPDVYVSRRGQRTVEQRRNAAGAMARGLPEKAVGAVYAATPYDRAVGFDRAAGKAAELVEKALARYAASDLLVATLTPKDLLDISRAACLLSARAQGVMAGPAGSSGGMPGDTQNGTGLDTVGVDISALEAGPSDEDLLQAADDVIRQFKLHKGGQADAVEADSREVS